MEIALQLIRNSSFRFKMADYFYMIAGILFFLWTPCTSNLSCNQKKSCEIDVILNSVCRSTDENPPGPFYEFFPKMGYYKLHTDSKVWQEAKYACESEGTHLAVINSPAEVKILQEFRLRLPNAIGNGNDNLAWLGISDIKREGFWETVFNQPMSQTGFTDWEEGQPSNGQNENCGCMVINSGKLHDCLCSDVLPFLCEREL